MIPLLEAAPVLRALRARLLDRRLHSDDLPAAYVRLLYGLPEDAPVSSRVDQLAKRNRDTGTSSLRSRGPFLATPEGVMHRKESCHEQNSIGRADQDAKQGPKAVRLRRFAR